jgi:hypothetical protein
MSTTDPYGTTNKLDDTVLQASVTRLEARRTHPFFARIGCTGTNRSEVQEYKASWKRGMFKLCDMIGMPATVPRN